MLSPFRALDLTDETGFLCGKILADLGADVIKIEPPGGDAARLIGPFPGDEMCLEKSLYWHSYNANKRGITLNLEKEQGRELFRRLLKRVDFLIESMPPGRLADLGFDTARLRAVNKRLVIVSITPFGQSGPYKGYKGKDLVAMAMSGMMSLVGEAGQAPLRVSLPQAPMWAGMYAAAGALIAHYHRNLTGRGQQVDCSLQAGMLWALANAPAFWATNKTVPVRAGRQVTGRSITGATMQALYRCQDGYINFIIYGGAAGARSNQALVAWLVEEGLVPEEWLERDWARFDIAKSTQAEIDEIEGPAAKLFSRITKREFLEQGFRRGMLGYPVANAADILDDPHLQARDFWHELHVPALDRTIRFPGAFAHFSQVEVGPKRPAPSIGQHNQEIYGDELGLSAAEMFELKSERVI